VSMNETLQIIGGLLGSGVIGAMLNGWWKARKDKRADAVDSEEAKTKIADAKAQTNTIETLQRERHQAVEDRIASDSRLDKVIDENVELRISKGRLESKLEHTESKLRRALARLPPEVAEIIETDFGGLGKH
jgi:seryl-tRNA synthetase